jgi:hypothetical protein
VQILQVKTSKRNPFCQSGNNAFFEEKHHRLKFTMGNSVDQEIAYLITAIQRLGSKQADEKWKVKYGALVKDDEIANTLEGLFGTLKAARKRKIVQFDGELLLSPTHDNVDVILLKEQVA